MAGTGRLRSPSRREGIGLVVLVVGALLWSGIAPHDRLTWLLEVVWVIAGLPLVLLSAFIPGMGAGALVLVLGFYGGSLALMTLAVLLLLGFGSLYYYDLGLTLMTKSWLLLGSGALLLGTRHLLKTLGREIAS